MPAFIAANYIMTYYCEHGICPMEAELPTSTDTIMIDRDIHLRQIAEICHIDINELRGLNPQYRVNEASINPLIFSIILLFLYNISQRFFFAAKVNKIFYFMNTELLKKF